MASTGAVTETSFPSSAGSGLSGLATTEVWASFPKLIRPSFQNRIPKLAKKKTTPKQPPTTAFFTFPKSPRDAMSVTMSAMLPPGGESTADGEPRR